MDYSPSSNAKRKRRQNARVHTKRLANKISLIVFRLITAVILVGGFAVVGTGIGVYFGVLQNAPKISLNAIQPDIYTSFILDGKTGEVIESLKGDENRVYVQFKNMPDNLKNAFVAIEDERFYSHNGVDARGIGRALYRALVSRGTTQEGASTITQQLIKNNLGKNTNTLVTKLQEQYLAIQFEKQLAQPENYGSKKAAKDHILEVYLNTINLGRGYHGVQTAARNYYGKDVSELTLSECATIACITQNPTKYPPDLRPENNAERAQKVLKKMLDLGFITEGEYDEAIADPVYDRVITGAIITNNVGVVHSYFTDALILSVTRDLQRKFNISENESFYWLYNRGLQIFSTQDSYMQSIVDEVMMDDSFFPAGDFEIDVEYRLSVQNSITKKITNHNRKKTVKKEADVAVFTEAVKNELLTSNDDILGEMTIATPQPQASFIVIDYHNGHVKAISGGRGEKPVNLAWNRAIDTVRSPGSQFKITASYAPALDMGLITPATVIDDIPYVYEFPGGSQPPYSPRNWWGNHWEGLNNVRKGIWHSMNVLAVKNLINTGIDPCFTYLQNFGFTTLVEGERRSNGNIYSDKGPSLALGGMTDGVKTIELAAAYGAIANLGELIVPVFYTKVLDHDGKILLENIPDPKRVLKPSSAYLLTDMMVDTVRIGTGTRAAFRNVQMPIAGKTGTSTDTVDLGFTGYTPYYVASVWLGFDQQKKIVDDGNRPHLRIWSEIMGVIHENLQTREFEKPSNILTVTVCRDSGMLPTDLCRHDPRGNREYSELFAAGTQPTEECRVHQQISVDRQTEMRAGPGCPSYNIVKKIGIVRPIPYEGSESVADRAYELLPSLLYGPECIIHNFQDDSHRDDDMFWPQITEMEDYGYQPNDVPPPDDYYESYELP